MQLKKTIMRALKLFFKVFITSLFAAFSFIAVFGVMEAHLLYLLQPVTTSDPPKPFAQEQRKKIRLRLWQRPCKSFGLNVYWMGPFE